MKKFLVLTVALSIMLVGASVASADSRPMSQGEIIFVDLVPDVIGSAETAKDVFAKSPRQYEVDVVADTWLVMSDAGRACLKDIATDTQAAWKKQPGATKNDCMMDIISELAGKKPANATMASVSAKTLKEFGALNTLDKSYVLSAYGALTVLVQNFGLAK